LKLWENSVSKKNRFNCHRKNIIPLLATIFILFLFRFTVCFKNTIIIVIAENIYKNRFVFLSIIALVTAYAAAFKNRCSYYLLLKKVDLILCYLGFASRIIVGNIRYGECSSCILMLIFTVLFWMAFCFFPLKEENEIQIERNFLEAIKEYKDLFNSRNTQAKTLIKLITGDEGRKGCSVCVSGEWGCGKTSFINGVIDSLKSNSDENDVISIDEIRINAMELDDLASLVTYFFARIKQILKTNNVYVGIKSEYQELISSMIGTIVGEKTGSFIKNMFPSDSNYRENIDKLNSLISEHLKNRRIVIVVDDIERCTEEKIMDFLFFAKELAMLRRCVVVFLTDIEKLKYIESIDEEFLEKFFNYRINLKKADLDEILKSINVDETFAEYIKESEKIYKQLVESAENENNQKVTKETAYEKRFISMDSNYSQLIRNPRKLNHVYSKYFELLNTANYSENNDEDYNKFLDKVDYKKQIFLLSLYYGLSLPDFELIESNGVEEYSQKFNIYNLKHINYTYISLDGIANIEWNSHTMRGNSYYILNEKFRFINYLLSEPTELKRIANGHHSKRDEYIEQINKDIKPNDSMEIVLKTLLTYSLDLSEDDEFLICKYLEMCKNDKTFDELVVFLSSDLITYNIARNMWLIKKYYEIYKNKIIINDKITKTTFYYFAEESLRRCLMNVTYFVSLYNEDMNINSAASEVVYNKPNCNKMIEAYCESVVSKFKLDISNDNNEKPVNYLKKIHKKALDSYINCWGSFPQDLIKLEKSSEATIEFVEYILKFEEKITSTTQGIIPNDEIIGDNFSDKLKNTLSKIKGDNFKHSQKFYDGIVKLLQDINSLNTSIPNFDIKTIEEIIKLYYEKTSIVPIQLRMMQKKIIEKSKLKV